MRPVKDLRERMCGMTCPYAYRATPTIGNMDPNQPDQIGYLAYYDYTTKEYFIPKTPAQAWALMAEWQKNNGWWIYSPYEWSPETVTQSEFRFVSEHE